jgi:N-carbamoyl-L-amino-acid hydrolase
MDPAIQTAFVRASDDVTGGRHLTLPSGAGHDAQMLAQKMPAGMLFVPSIGGISHHWSEDTAEADIVTGVEVFVAACMTLLKEAGG